MSPWLALAPLSFFVAYLAAALQNGTGADSLWMCHVSNLILAAGIAGRWPRVIGLAVCWIVVGIPLWLYDMVQTGEVTVVSVLSHLGGLAFGMYALRRVRISYNPWLPALVVYLVVQQACRWFTPAELNVNLAHRAYEGWDRLPGGYAAYWLGLTLTGAMALWATGRALIVLFPERHAGEAT
ncbi:MAG TPA: hypothetical protein VKE95_15240 [Burkholderiales bacterium]|nr:hypothetical protein [Burkholderiales bacterium]